MGECFFWYWLTRVVPDSPESCKMVVVVVMYNGYLCLCTDDCLINAKEHGEISHGTDHLSLLNTADNK